MTFVTPSSALTELLAIASGVRSVMASDRRRASSARASIGWQGDSRIGPESGAESGADPGPRPGRVHPGAADGRADLHPRVGRQGRRFQSVPVPGGTGLRRPSAEILAQIAHGLSISVESLLAKAGILETAEAPEVVAAIRGDAVLTERQKSALIDIYAAFRKEAETAVGCRALSRSTAPSRAEPRRVRPARITAFATAPRPIRPRDATPRPQPASLPTAKPPIQPTAPIARPRPSAIKASPPMPEGVPCHS